MQLSIQTIEQAHDRIKPYIINTPIKSNKEINDLVGSRVISSKELEDAKAALIRSFPASFETSGHIAGRLEDLVSYGLNDDEFVRSVQAIQDLSLD